MNYWDNLMGTDEGASVYMDSYGEGPGFDTRFIIGEFLNEREKVLDVGCGPGWNFEHFRKYGPRIHYYGIDYSERFIRVANKRFVEQFPVSKNKQILSRHYGGTPFTKGDARNLHYRDNSFDVVLLQDVLEHTNGYEIPIKEALRVAKKRVIMSFWHLTEDDDHINDDGDDGWGAWYSRPKLEEFLNTLDYVWFDFEIAPEGKTHKWNFYIIDKELA